MKFKSVNTEFRSKGDASRQDLRPASGLGWSFCVGLGLPGSKEVAANCFHVSSDLRMSYPIKNMCISECSKE